MPRFGHVLLNLYLVLRKVVLGVTSTQRTRVSIKNFLLLLIIWFIEPR